MADFSVQTRDHLETKTAESLTRSIVVDPVDAFKQLVQANKEGRDPARSNSATELSFDTTSLYTKSNKDSDLATRQPSPYQDVLEQVDKKYGVQKKDLDADISFKSDAGLKATTYEFSKQELAIGLKSLSQDDVKSIFADKLAAGVNFAELKQQIEKNPEQVFAKLTTQEREKLETHMQNSAPMGEPIKNYSGYKGEGLHRDVEQGEALVKPGDSLWRLARQHLGKDATEQEVYKYVKEIAQTNFNGDLHHVIHPGDKVKLPGHKQDGTFSYEDKEGKTVVVKPDGSAEREGEKPSRQRRDNSEMSLEHQKLEAMVDKLKEPERSQFKKDMEEFEKRAEKNGLSPKDVTDTYKQLERMLDAKGDKPMPQADRQKVASEVMHHAAYPNEIDQGNHNTCNTTTVEKRIYAQHPAEAARLVADISLTGEYKAKDGTVVHLNPTPHGESRNPHANGARDYASEIFQVTAINVHYEQENAKTNPRGQVRYEQIEVPPPQNLHDTGERLVDYSKNPPKGEEIQGPDGKPVRAPNLTDNDMCSMSEAITGKHEKGMLLTTPEALCGQANDDRLTVVHSEAELEKRVAEAKAKGELPLIVVVQCNNEPFNSEGFGNGKLGQRSDGHVVTISDYEPATPGHPAKVQMDNQWGSNSRHEMSMHDLYRSMYPVSESAKLLEKDVQWNRQHNQVDYSKEFELLAIKKHLGQVNETDYEKQTGDLIKQMKQHFDKDNPSPEERAREIKTMNEAIAQMPADAQIRFYQQAYQMGVIDQNQFDYDVALAGWKSRQEMSHVGEVSDPKEQARIRQEYDAAREQLRRTLSTMPEAERVEILKRIEEWTKQYG